MSHTLPCSPPQLQTPRQISEIQTLKYAQEAPRFEKHTRPQRDTSRGLLASEPPSRFPNEQLASQRTARLRPALLASNRPPRLPTPQPRPLLARTPSRGSCTARSTPSPTASPPSGSPPPPALDHSAAHRARLHPPIAPPAPDLQLAQGGRREVNSHVADRPADGLALTAGQPAGGKSNATLSRCTAFRVLERHRVGGGKPSVQDGGGTGGTVGR